MIKTDQVPILLSLQTELQEVSPETYQTIARREALDLFSNALPQTTLAIALNKGMASNIEDLYKSVNESESAKLKLAGLNPQNSQDSKKIAALEVQPNGLDVSAQTDNSTEKLQKEIKRLKAEIANMKKKSGKKYCSFHKTTSHDTKECKKLQSISESAPNSNQYTQRRFIITEDGSKNLCGYCATHRLKLPTANCRHCWKHSNPGKAVPSADCGSCKFNRRIKDRPEVPPGASLSTTQRPAPPPQATQPQTPRHNGQN